MSDFPLMENCGKFLSVISHDLSMNWNEVEEGKNERVLEDHRALSHLPLFH
jgi:hypothetical protein